MSEPAFRIQRTSAGAMEILSLYGELDIASRPRLDAAIETALATKPLVVSLDLRGLSFMDATGIHVLVSTERRCQDLGQRFLLVRGGPPVQRVLDASGLASYFETVDAPDWTGAAA